jgi:clan AA aspartic protease
MDDDNRLSTLINAGPASASSANVPLFTPKSEKKMGVFSVPVKLTNWQNRFLPPELQGAEAQCEALVDSGAAELALPTEIIEQLRLEPVDVIRVFTADGARHEYRVFGIVELEVQGRKCQVRAIELPRGAKPLLGAVPLEEMDWHVSPLEQKLVPSPRSPDRPALPLC